jgi:hypothetical protein
MKTLHFIVILVTVIILPAYSSLGIFDNTMIPDILSPKLPSYLADHGYAIVPSNTTEWFLWWSNYRHIQNYSDTSFTGNITSVKVLNVTSFYTIGNITQTLSPMEGIQYITGPPYKKINYTLNLDQYTVNIDEFLKNSSSTNNMTIREPVIDPTWHSDPPGPRFNIGDHVLFYVKHLDGDNVYSQNSFTIPNSCNAKDVFAQDHFAGNILTMAQNGIKVDYSKNVGDTNHFAANMPIQFMYSAPTDTLSGKNSFIKYEIENDDHYHGLVLSKVINFDSTKCDWTQSTEWELNLQSGNYYANIYVKNDDGTFRPTYSAGFSVNPYVANNSSLLNSEKIPTARTPEFQFATPILLISIVSVIVCYRIIVMK